MAFEHLFLAAAKVVVLLLGMTIAALAFLAYRRSGERLMLGLSVGFALMAIGSFLEGFTGVVFVDGGQTWGASGNEGFKVDYGVGVAFKSPLGVLRLDYAFGPEGNQLWLNLGHPF